MDYNSSQSSYNSSQGRHPVLHQPPILSSSLLMLIDRPTCYSSLLIYNQWSTNRSLHLRTLSNAQSIPSPTLSYLIVSWILSSLSEELLPTILGLESTANIWATLASSVWIVDFTTLDAASKQSPRHRRRCRGVPPSCQVVAESSVPTCIFNVIIYNNLGEGNIRS